MNTILEAFKELNKQDYAARRKKINESLLDPSGAKAMVGNAARGISKLAGGVASILGECDQKNTLVEDDDVEIDNGTAYVDDDPISMSDFKDALDNPTKAATKKLADKVANEGLLDLNVDVKADNNNVNVGGISKPVGECDGKNCKDKKEVINERDGYDPELGVGDNMHIDDEFTDEDVKDVIRGMKDSKKAGKFIYDLKTKKSYDRLVHDCTCVLMSDEGDLNLGKEAENSPEFAAIKKHVEKVLKYVWDVVPYSYDMNPDGFGGPFYEGCKNCDKEIVNEEDDEDDYEEVESEIRERTPYDEPIEGLDDVLKELKDAADELFAAVKEAIRLQDSPSPVPDAIGHVVDAGEYVCELISDLKQEYDPEFAKEDSEEEEAAEPIEECDQAVTEAVNPESRLTISDVMSMPLIEFDGVKLSHMSFSAGAYFNVWVNSSLKSDSVGSVNVRFGSDKAPVQTFKNVDLNQTVGEFLDSNDLLPVDVQANMLESPVVINAEW